MVFKIRQSSVFMFTNNVNVNKTGPPHSTSAPHQCTDHIYSRRIWTNSIVRKGKCFTLYPKEVRETRNKETAYLAVCIVG